MRSVAKGTRATLSLWLVLWLGFFPVLQSLHLALADHDHCFCQEHHQIEDVPRRACSVSRADLEPEGDAGPSRVSRDRKVSGPADLLLNFSLQNSISKRVQPTWIPRDGQFQDVASRPADVISSFSHILVAPKTSPPSLAA